MKTPHVQTIQDDVLARFPGSRAGQWLCRRIAGLTTWSQHSYTEGEYLGNAADIFPISMAQGDAIAAYIRTLPNVKVVLWRVKNHFTHIHYDTWPTGIGLPPCKGGALRVRHKDGTIGRTFKPTSPPPNIDEMVLKEGDKGDAVKVFQKSLNKWGGGGPVVVDGIYGPTTTAAVTSYQHAADIDKTGTIDGVTAALLIRYQ